MDKKQKKGTKGVNAGNFACADFKSLKWDEVTNNTTKVDVWALKLHGSTARFSKTLYTGRNGAFEFIKTLQTKRISCCYLTNLTDNVDFIKASLEDNGYNEVDSNYPEENEFNIFRDVTLKSNKVYCIKIRTNRSRKEYITIKCAQNVLANLSIEDLASKLKVVIKSYDNITDDQIEEVFDNRLSILVDAIDKISDNYKIKLTTPGTALADYREWFNSKYPGGYININGVNKPCDPFTLAFGGKINGYQEDYSILNCDQYEMIHNSYIGGYTACKPGLNNVLINEHGKAYDCNSMYPSVALEGFFPYGKAFDQPKKHWKHTCEFIEVEITSAKPLNNNVIPMFRLKTQKKWVSEINSFNKGIFVFTLEEFNFIKKHYTVKYNVISNLYFEGKQIFKNWLKDKIKLKEKATQKGLEFEALFNKMIYNSVFGKMAQESNEKTVELNIFGEEMERTNGVYHIGVASYILSYARIELWSVISSNYDAWIYSDTDSVWLKGSVINGVILDNSKVGAWKIEKEFSVFKTIKQKTYLYKDLTTNDHILTACGCKLSKEVVDITFDEFKPGMSISNAKTIKCFIKGGSVKKDITFTVKE